MTAGRVRPLRLRVGVSAAPSPHLLRIAIETRLAGRAFGAGPEDAVAEAVADAVRTHVDLGPRREPETQRWR